jgi:soluble lytic murein transglycosylase-like protein
MCRRRVPVVLAALLGASPAPATVLTIADDGRITVLPPLPASPLPVTPRPPAPPRALARPLGDAAAAARLADELVAAIAWVESRYEPRALSPAGAVGVMQLMPATARELRVDPHDPAANLAGGAAYLRLLLDRFDGDLVRTIAAYNAGPGAVERYGGVPPFPETRRYVAAVMARLAALALP